MSAGQIFLVVVSGLGVIHGLFLAIFLWIYPKGNPTANKILSLLLLVLSFRIGKSVFLEFAENLDAKFIFIGLGTLMAIGPLFYLYCHACANKNLRLQQKQLIHFIPAMLGIGFGFWIRDSHLETLPIQIFAVMFLSYYMHYLVYIIVGYSYVTRQKAAGLSPTTFNLLRLLFFGLLVIWIAYVLNLFDESIPYVVGPVLYSVVAYVISFIVTQKGYIHKVDQLKYKTTPVSDEQMDYLYEKVQKMLSEDQQYREPNLTLKSMSEALNVSTQVLSMVINQKSQVNFNSFVNQYRITESINLFNNSQYDNHTIAAIAFEVGFNSISSFNKAFKDQTGKSPMAYRQQLTK